MWILVFFAMVGMASEPTYFRVDTQGSLARISESQSQELLAPFDWIVLSERHDTAWVQDHQATVVRWHSQRIQQTWSLAWEFLPHTRSEQISNAWSEFMSGALDATGLLQKWFAPSSHGYPTYAPIMETLKDLGLNVFATNLTRAEKAPVVRAGLAALDPVLLPRDFVHGSAAYRERFSTAMGDHASPEQIANYFDAQVLTDEVMAQQIALNGSPRGALVVGSFHADFHDGVVASLKRRLPVSLKVGVVRYVDRSDLGGQTLTELAFDARYGGPIAHVLVVK